ncbi:angiotensin-converting enzyme 2-like [Lytechinus pictus]|uniref:angiotensin-converting enzyme 2-like n=1 Tax=Lytechinus pictus TaxID=7653 RepID=UPI0030B9CDEB
MAARKISNVESIPTFGLLLLCLLHLTSGNIQDVQEYLPPSLETARQFLQDYNNAYPRVKETSASASWNYQRNMTAENLKISTQETLKASAFEKRSAKYVRVFDSVVDTFPSDIRRELKFVRNIGVSALNNDTVAEFYKVQGQMQRNYASARVCRPNNLSDCLRFDPGLKDIMADSTDWDERLWAWKGFRDEVGLPNKPLFARYVDLANEGSRANGNEIIIQINNIKQTKEIRLKYISRIFTIQASKSMQSKCESLTY